VRVVVVGIGSIGRRYVRNLKNVVPDCEVVACRHTGAVELPTDIAALVSKVVLGVEAAVGCSPDAVIVANPAPFHVAAAQPFAEQGIPLLVEKPISASLDGVAELVASCANHGAHLLVGYTLRFNAGLRALKESLDRGDIGRPLSLVAQVGQYLPDWRPGSDFRKTVTARR